MSAVEVSELVVRYGGPDAVPAVDHLSFSADAGEVVAVLGVNGAGKTSTIEVLEGLRRATSGRARVAGVDVMSRPDEVGDRIGVLLQDGGLATGARPAEVVTHQAALLGVDVDADAALAEVGLDPDAVRRRTIRRLSGGEQRRVGLAVALVGRPEVVFLDEPTSGVDVQGRRTIRAVVDRVRSAGACVVLTTHELDEAARMADRLVVIHRGQLVAEGTLDALTDGGRRDLESAFLELIGESP